jgi:hypothetical protein
MQLRAKVKKIYSAISVGYFMVRLGPYHKKNHFRRLECYCNKPERTATWMKSVNAIDFLIEFDLVALCPYRLDDLPYRSESFPKTS